jgi:hypothetical protein
MPATTDFKGSKAVDEVLNAAEAGIDRRLGDLALLAIGLGPPAIGSSRCPEAPRSEPANLQAATSPPPAHSARSRSGSRLLLSRSGGTKNAMAFARVSSPRRVRGFAFGSGVRGLFPPPTAHAVSDHRRYFALPASRFAMVSTTEGDYQSAVRLLERRRYRRASALGWTALRAVAALSTAPAWCSYRQS